MLKTIDALLYKARQDPHTVYGLTLLLLVL